MVCADVIDDQLLQQITKQSNMFDVGTDILTKLINDSQNEPYDIDETTITFQPFVDSFPDLCAGFQFDFDMTTIYNKDCNLPFQLGSWFKHTKWDGDWDGSHHEECSGTTTKR